MWTAWQYRAVWSNLYDQCDQQTQTKLDYHLDLLKEKGIFARRPISAHLDEGIFELRANRARMLFYFGSAREIVFVHCIFKKTRKVPRDDIEQAKRVRSEIQRIREKPNALPN
jgi:phage-related protein